MYMTKAVKKTFSCLTVARNSGLEYTSKKERESIDLNRETMQTAYACMGNIV